MVGKRTWTIEGGVRSERILVPGQLVERWRFLAVSWNVCFKETHGISSQRVKDMIESMKRAEMNDERVQGYLERSWAA